MVMTSHPNTEVFDPHYPAGEPAEYNLVSLLICYGRPTKFLLD